MMLNTKIKLICFPKINRTILWSMFIMSMGIMWSLFVQMGWADKREEVEKKEIFKLDEITVTGTRTERFATDVPASITVIDKEEIEASPFQTIYDILRTTAGLDVGSPYVAETFFHTVNVRGTGGYGDRTLVLVDGIPQNNANNGWVEWTQIPKDVIERIEIVRGSSSALYGSNAMGGVINIITRKPQKERLTTLETEYGSANTYSVRLGQEQGIGDWGYLVSGGYESTDGYIIKKPEQSYDTKLFRRLDTIYGKLTYDTDKHSTATVGFSRLNKKVGSGRKYFYGYTKSDHYWIDWARNGERIDWKAQVFVNNDEWEWYYDRPPTYDFLNMYENIPMLGIGGSLQSSIDLSERNNLTLGLDYKRSKIEKEDRYYVGIRDSGVEGKQNYLSTFFSDEIKFFDSSLIINLGGRYDEIKSYDGKNWDTNPAPNPAYSNDFSSKTWREFSPKLGVTYHIGGCTTLKSSIGRGFKAPSLYELYSTLIRGPVLIQANPELKPEKILSYDLSIEHLFADYLLGRLTIYQAHAKDFIGYAYPGPFTWKRENIGKVRMQGIETEIDWRINPQWQSFLNYTYNKSEIREYTSNPTVEGNDLPQTPRHKVGAGIIYTNPDLVNFRVSYNYACKRYTANDNATEIESYSTIDMSIWRQLFKYCELSIDIENLLDSEYTISKWVDHDSVSPGRVIRGSVRLRF